MNGDAALGRRLKQVNRETAAAASRGLTTITKAAWIELALLVVALSAVGDWLSVTTSRLYMDDSAAKQIAGVARQQFNVRGQNVQPQIIAEDNARFVFRAGPGALRNLVFTAESKAVASYEIYAHRNGIRRLIARETIEKSRARKIPLPRGDEELEFVTHGAITWVDIRLVRRVFLWPFYLMAAAAGIAALMRREFRSKLPQRSELLIFGASSIVCLLVAEAVLGAIALTLPSAVIAARREFGLAGQDTRWIDPARYKLRLKPNLNTYMEWRYGGIVRLGFLSKEVSRATVHRYTLRTDAEGFRNEAVRAKIDVAALGDSFTDGATGPVEESWPARLAALSNRVVQNYGTSGFGPQQESYALRDYALKHRPQVAVLAFYGSNDLRDGEVFADWERNPARSDVEREGWELARSFRRLETFYLWTLTRVGASSLLHLVRPETDRPGIGEWASAPPAPVFDRGMFRIPVQGHGVEFAFLPPYLRQLATPRAEIEAGRGWQLAREALHQMAADCAANGTAFVVMFIPEKAQVYWALAERAFSPAELQRALDFYCPPDKGALRPEDVAAHRLALNGIVTEFCARDGIPMFDLTDRLQREVEAGRETYFPDDPHWNAHGHDVAARALAEFLSRQP